MRILGLLALMALVGCDDGGVASGCVIAGAPVAVGETAADPLVCVICTCQGPGQLACRPDKMCVDATVEPDRGAGSDASPDSRDAGPIVDAGPAVDADLAPACPAEPPRAPEPCGSRPRQCVYGAPVRCCGAAFAEGSSVCTCVQGRYQCVDTVAECADHVDRSRCAPEMCPRFLAMGEDRQEGNWSGDLRSCMAGDMDAAWRARALAAINTYRWMAGLPPVGSDPVRTRGAQLCALALHANEIVEHDLPRDGPCVTDEALEAAPVSNIAAWPAVASIKLYMDDPGERNERHLAHRRWLLSNQLGPVGIGSTDRYSCVWVGGGEGAANRRGVGWPPAGPFPWREARDLDRTGWSYQTDHGALQGADVEVIHDGRSMSLEITGLQDRSGSLRAIKFKPLGWQSEPGEYHVRIDGDPEVRYTVELVDCGVYRE